MFGVHIINFRGMQYFVIKKGTYEGICIKTLHFRKTALIFFKSGLPKSSSKLSF